MMLIKVLTKIEVQVCVCVCLTWAHSDISGVFINDLDLLREAVLLHNALGCLGHGLEDLEQQTTSGSHLPTTQMLIQLSKINRLVSQ